MRVVIYDRYPGFGVGNALLYWAWAIGAHLQYLVGLADEVHGAESWDDAANWLKSLPQEEIAQLEIWGHGGPGRPYMSQMPASHDTFNFLRGRVGVLWFRSCSVLQGRAGQLFSGRVADAVGCTVAGHTRIIGLVQGGLRTRQAHTTPSWSETEGELSKSWIPPYLRWGPRSILCTTTRIPAGW